VSDPDYTPEKAGRLSKLEGAISKQRTVKFRYWSIQRDETRERTLDPYALLPHEGGWYVIGRDHDADAIRTFRVSRIRGEIRFGTRRERDFRLPPGFNAEEHRPPAPWQMGKTLGEARIELVGDTAWWVERRFGAYGRVDNGVFVTPYSDVEHLAAWVLRQAGRAAPVAPDALRSSGSPKRRLPTAPAGRRNGQRVRLPQSASRCSKRCSRICSPPAATLRTRGSRRRSSSSVSRFRSASSRSTFPC
jgi:predicted DNA-binding transcriptional regulator YafY